MTHKVKMPPPLIEGGVYHPELKIMYRGMVYYTADQMEAYAAAKVREALCEAYSLMDGIGAHLQNAHDHDDSYWTGVGAMTQAAETAIQALIPK